MLCYKIRSKKALKELIQNNIGLAKIKPATVTVFVTYVGLQCKRKVGTQQKQS